MMLVKTGMRLLCSVLFILMLSACGFEREDLLPTEYFVISSVVGPEGDMTPRSIEVKRNQQAVFVITANSGFRIASVTGCDGSLTEETTYTTGRIRADCSVRVRFEAIGTGINPFQTLPSA